MCSRCHAAGQADCSGRVRKPATARGERDPPPLADEQIVAELSAERGHRNRDGGLGHLELGRRRLDRTEPGDERERLQLGKSHRMKEVIAARSYESLQQRLTAAPT